MTLASKFAQAVLLLGLLTTVILGWYLTGRDFDRALAQLINGSEYLVREQAALPALIDRRDGERLSAHLDRHLSRAAVRYAAVIDNDGTRLAARFRDTYSGADLADRQWLRQATQPLDSAFRERDLPASRERPAQGLSRLMPWMRDERVSDVSVPIVSLVNPLIEEINAQTLFEAAMSADGVRSLSVLGYVNVGISHSSVSDAVRGTFYWTLLIGGLVAAAIAGIAWYYAHTLLGSLAALAETARQAATKTIDVNQRFRASGEAGHIAMLMNTVLAELKSYRAQLGIDRDLLHLKVEEQGSMLTERDQQLDRARTAVSRSRADLHRMAYYDSLTGLPNRRFFTEQLALMLRLCERQDKLLALMFLDLDNFKRINDSLGHSAGDLLLREVGIRLTKSMRGSDIIGHYVDSPFDLKVSRLGGDEFTIVLNNLKAPHEAGIIAERVLSDLIAPMVIDNHELTITPSIGIAIGPRDAGEVEGLLKAADTAMYAAKTSGKNNFVFYSNKMKTSDVMRLHLETDLRHAIERNELVLYYQPIVSLRSGTVVGAESLIRWQHPERGLIGPGEFIPLAEEMGMILDIGEWTLEEACRLVASRDLSDSELTKLSVNISPLAVSRGFAERVKHIISATQADPAILQLELTENVLMESNATSIESLHNIKKLGVSLSIDDFGTGYSSLSYLSHFPLDTLKIDRSFVMDFSKSQANRGLVEAIAAMAHRLDLQVVAEGVETADQLQFMRRLRVELIQGYYFSRPVPATKLVHLLRPGHFKAKVDRGLLRAPEGLTMKPA